MIDVLLVAMICRITIGLLFAVSVLGKVRSPRAFAAFTSEMRRLAPMPVDVTRAVAPLVCLLEAAVTALLLISATVTMGMVLAAALLVAFSVAVVSAWRNRADASCHCFGFRAGTFGRRHLLRNAGLVTMCAVGVVSVHLQPDGQIEVVGLALAAAGGFAIVAVVVFMDDIAFLLSDRPNGR